MGLPYELGKLTAKQAGILDTGIGLARRAARPVSQMLGRLTGRSDAMREHAFGLRRMVNDARLTRKALGSYTLHPSAAAYAANDTAAIAEAGIKTQARYGMEHLKKMRDKLVDPVAAGIVGGAAGGGAAGVAGGAKSLWDYLKPEAPPPPPPEPKGFLSSIFGG